MKKMYEDITSGIVLVDTAPVEPEGKGKEKVGSKIKDAEGPSAPQKKKKTVTITQLAQPAMTEVEYDLIAARIHEKIKERFNALQTS